MITGEHDKLKEIAQVNVCSKHKMSLEVAWYQKQWVLRCGGDGGHYPDAVTRQLGLTEELKTGAHIDEPVRSKIIKGAQRRRRMQDKSKAKEEYGLMPLTDLGSGNLLIPDQVQLLLDYAKKCKLNAWLGHVALMYGKPYPTLEGYLFKAHESKRPYNLVSRPMTTQEHESYKLGSTDHGWLAKVQLIDTGEEKTGIGIVSYKELTEPSKRDLNIPAAPVVAAHPQLMGQKRAEWQALRRAFPIGGE